MKNFLAASLLAGFALATAAANPVVEMETSAGSISIELYPEKAPGTVENFLTYAREGFYSGTVFHRVIDGFMIQGGGFDASMKEKTTREPIKNEAKNGLQNKTGAIAMARTRDPHSASAQFFINLVDNPSLDHPSFDGWGYAVFGQVTKGMEVVRQIGKVRTTTVGYYQDVPAQAVVIKSVRIIKNRKTDK